MSILLLLGLILLAAACNKKHINTPDEANPGHWTLVMRAPAVMYMGPEGHVANQTIPVRLYDPEGHTAQGVAMQFYCTGSPNNVTGNASSRSDTVALPAGCQPPLTYWGTGGSTGIETIYAKVFTDPDTLYADVSFRVEEASGNGYTLRLINPTKFHRGTGGAVVNGLITVRLLSSTGQLPPPTEIVSSATMIEGAVPYSVTTTSDTIGQNVCGTNPPLMYNGPGPSNPDSMETVKSFAVVGTDTIRAQTRFYVLPMPRLVLLGPPIMYRDTTTGHVMNDTIPVRLYGDRGTVLNNIQIHCSASLGDHWVTEFAQTLSDTTALRGAGCNPPLMYWGEGSTEADQFEVVSCWCLVEGDTIRGQSAFYVRNP